MAENKKVYWVLIFDNDKDIGLRIGTKYKNFLKVLKKMEKEGIVQIKMFGEEFDYKDALFWKNDV